MRSFLEQINKERDRESQSVFYYLLVLMPSQGPLEVELGES